MPLGLTSNPSSLAQRSNLWLLSLHTDVGALVELLVEKVVHVHSDEHGEAQR